MSYFKDKLQRLHQLQIDGRHERYVNTEQQEDYPVQFCLNCGMEFQGNYCPHCGQSAKTSRLSLSTVFSQAISTIVNLERGFVRTCVELFYRPGYMIRDYIEGKRADYHKPVSMLFMLATLQIIVHYLFFHNTGEQFYGYNADFEGNETLERFMQIMLQVLNFLRSNQALTTILFVFMVILPNWLVYRLTEYGRRLNLAEHFYIMLFIGCQLMIFNVLQIPYSYFSHTSENLFVFATSYSSLFAIIDFKQLYKISLVKSLFLFILSSFLTLLLFIIVFTIVVIIYVKVFDPPSM